MKEKVLLLGSEGCGTGDCDLGYSIMVNLLEALAGRKDKPSTIIMWNTAVNLMLKDAPTSSRLKKLEEQGVKILAGKLCVNELGVADKLATGRIAGMDEILNILLDPEINVVSL